MDRDEQRKRIGQRIAAVRKEKGLTQAELAERSGYAQSHIARIEAGRYSVGFDTMEEIAEAMGKKVDLVPSADAEGGVAEI